MTFLLDTSALSELCKRGRAEAAAAKGRLQSALSRGEDIRVPAISLYETLRGLLRINARRDAEKLEELAGTLGVEELSWPVWRRGAEIWADLRRRGEPVASKERIDFDVLLGALAESLGATVVTENVRHFEAIGVAVQDWGAW